MRLPCSRGTRSCGCPSPSTSISVSPAISPAVLRRSLSKLLRNLSVASFPTTTAKTTRITKVSAAETPARRQEIGQRRGLNPSGGFDSVAVIGPGRSEHVAGASLGVEQPRLVALFELAAEVRDEDV